MEEDEKRLHFAVGQPVMWQYRANGQIVTWRYGAITKINKSTCDIMMSLSGNHKFSPRKKIRIRKLFLKKNF